MKAITASLALSMAAAAVCAEEPSREALALKQAEAVERDLVRLAETVRPSSVTVLNYRKVGKQDVVGGGGSGVIIKSSGLALTNEHVVKGASRIEVVLLDGRRLPATVESRVAEYDIVLLRIVEADGKPAKGLKAATLGRSASLKDAQWVVATGNPFFLAPAGAAVTTLGTVSAQNRVLGGEFFYGNALQHDAEINPGNSGGPLWDTQGRLVGINGKISSRPTRTGPSNSGVGFAIPIDQVMNFLQGLLGDTDGRVKAGTLGILVETARDDAGKEGGARIKEVKPSSPAATNKKGALQVDDVVTSVSIRMKVYPIRNATDYVNALAVWPEGTRIDAVEIRRGKRLMTLSGFVLGPFG